MKLIKRFWPVIFFLLIVIFFFWPVFLKGLVPFPGDLLVAEYKPWSTYSYLGYLPGTYPHKAQYFDTLRQIYPWQTLSLSLLKNNLFPLWNPHNFSGAPFLANFQANVFYPLNMVYFFLSQTTAWTLLIILQPLLAGLFIYLFGREIGLKKIGALLAAISFSFSGFMTVFLEYKTIGQTILWLPLALLLLEKLLKKQTVWRWLCLGLSLVMPFFAGHLPSAGLLFGFVIIYFFFRIGSQKWTPRKKINFGLKIIILLILSLGITAVQLMPTLELIGQSARTPHDYRFLIDKLLIQPKQLIMLLVPDFFGNPVTRNYWLTDTYPGKVTYLGLVPLIFSLFAAVFLWKNLLVRFFTLTAAIIFLLIISSPLTQLLYQLNLPFLSTSSPGNAIFLITFCLALLAGFGIDNWFKKKKKERLAITSVPLLSLFFLWLVILRLPQLIGLESQFFSVSFKNLLYSSLVFLAFAVILGLSFLKKGRQVAIFLFVFVAIFDLFYFFHKFNPFVPQDLVFPQAEVFSWLQEKAEVNRFWGYGLAQIEANFASQDQLFSPEGYDPLYPKKYGEFLFASREGKILSQFDATTRSDAIIAPGFGETDLVANPYREKILALLGTKYLLDRTESGSTEKTFPINKYRLVWESQGWRVFENLLTAPRAFLVSDYLLFKEKEAFESIFFSPDFKIQETILLEEKPEIDPEAAKIAEVKIKNYEANQVLLETKTDANQLLFLSDTDYPGWQALIDGKETKIYRANYAFRAVSVPKGEHQVLFIYQPPSFTGGVKISLVSLTLLLLFAYLSGRDYFLKR